MRLIRYFGTLSAAQVILWCYLCWYLMTVSRYFEPDATLWLSSLGISVVIGFALVLSTGASAHWPPTWVTFRLFLMPLCVSSYAALIKGRGFVLLFSTKWADNAACLAACAAFLLFHRACAQLVRGRSSP
jgi:hypothetical protein